MNKELINDLLITALEGGSNYWYILKTIPMNAERLLARVYDGESFTVYDAENNNEIVGEVNKATIKKGKKLFKEKEKEHYLNAMNDEWDAETSDVFFQFVVLGQITYG